MFAVCADVDALELVLSHGGTTSSADVHGGYAIHYAAQMCGNGACRSGDVRNTGVRVLQLLLSFGADVHVTDKHGRQPILWAASAGINDLRSTAKHISGVAISFFSFEGVEIIVHIGQSWFGKSNWAIRGNIWN